MLIDPQALKQLGEKLSLVAAKKREVEATRAAGRAFTANRIQTGDLQRALEDYRATRDTLTDGQRAWAEDALGGAAGADESQMLAMLERIDTEVRDLEERVTAFKEARDTWAEAAVSYGIPAYRIAKATGRTPSTVQRWLGAKRGN